MVFHVADLQRVTNSWASHHPLTGAESEMKESFKACEDTANSLRVELEHLQAKATNVSPAHDSSVLHNSLKDGNNDDSNIFSPYEIKYVCSFTINRARALTFWQSCRDSEILYQD
jgi:hypothetical protein